MNSRMQKLRYAYPLVFLFTTACASVDFGNNSYKLSVDALAVNDALSYSQYYLQPGKDIEPGLEYEQFAEQVENILDSKGLIRAKNLDQAKTIVVLSYKVGPTQQRPYVTSAPVWGPPGYPFGGGGLWFGSQYYPNAYYGPGFGVAGYQQISGVDTIYPMQVKLKAKTSGKDAKQLWEITVSANSGTGDLRKSFPYFMRAAQPYIGTNTNGKESVSVRR